MRLSPGAPLASGSVSGVRNRPVRSQRLSSSPAGYKRKRDKTIKAIEKELMDHVFCSVQIVIDKDAKWRLGFMCYNLSIKE